MIDLSKVVVRGGADEVLRWPVTSQLTEIGIEPGNLHTNYTKQGQWPAVPFGDAQQEATVWVFLQIAGQWFAAGAERLRPAQHDKPADPDPFKTIGTSWLFAEDRWREMAGYVPKAGELVGFMVVAGNTRSGFDVAVSERTDVVVVEFKPAHTFNVVWREGQPAVDKPPVILPEPAKPASDPDLLKALEAIRVDFAALNAAITTWANRPSPTESDYVGSLFGINVVLKPRK